MPLAIPDIRIRALISIQRALVGCITDDMRFISAEISEFRIALHVYIHGIMKDDSYEEFDAEAVTQIVADFPCPEKGDPMISCTFHRCDYPHKPTFQGTLVYGKKEK